MTNPSDAVGTNAGYNGRTSSKAFNDIMGAFSRGVVSGWTITPSTGMTVTIGGSATERDVAIAEDNAGNRTSINNRIGTPISVTISAAPVTNNRIDAIVAYAENSIQGEGASDVDFASGVGLIVVSGTTAANPVAPDDTAIRNAITTDGATGSSAYYVVLGTILVGTGVTTIGSGVITQGAKAQISASATLDLLSSVQTTIDNFKNSMNITQFEQSTLSTITGFTVDEITLTLAQSADGSIFKFYGNVRLTNTSSSGKRITSVAVPGATGRYGLATGLYLNTAPSSAFTINPAGVRGNHNEQGTICAQIATTAIEIGTDGQVYIFGTSNSSGLQIDGDTHVRILLEPCLYYNTNFGDSSES